MRVSVCINAIRSISVISFAALFLLPALPLHGQLALIALSAVGFDLGLQSALVSHQTLVYCLNAQARGRLNALLFTGVFIGMASGSVLGAKAMSIAGWPGGTSCRPLSKIDSADSLFNHTATLSVFASCTFPCRPLLPPASRCTPHWPGCFISQDNLLTWVSKAYLSAWRTRDTIA